MNQPAGLDAAEGGGEVGIEIEDLVDVGAAAAPGDLAGDGGALRRGGGGDNEIDAGQAFLKRSLITEEIPPTYAGDGAWLETTLANARVGYLDEVLSLHNQITGIDVSEPVERMT